MSNIVNETNQTIPLPVNIVTPVELLQLAVQQGADLEKLQQLMNLKHEWERNEARKSYHLAVANFKKESIEIIKNKKVSFKTSKGPTNYSHATLDHILDMAVPELAKHGLSHNWTPTQGDGGRITIKCTLTHAHGHAEHVELSGSPDDTGTKNNIQRMASTITYLERYTFLAITGLAARDHDDDGIGSGKQSGYNDGLSEGLAYGKACYKHKDVIENVKDLLADSNLEAAAEELYKLSNDELSTLRRAASKGGCFTTEEGYKMKSDEWSAARKNAVLANPGVDRSI